MARQRKRVGVGQGVRRRGASGYGEGEKGSAVRRWSVQGDAFGRGQVWRGQWRSLPRRGRLEGQDGPDDERADVVC